MKLLKTFILSASFFLMSIHAGFTASFMYVPIPSRNNVEVFDITSNPVPTKSGEFSIPNPQELAVSIDGSTIYVVHGTENIVSAVNSSDFTQKADISLDSSPKAVAASPDGQKIYVATAGAVENCGGKNVSVGKVAIISTSNRQIIKTLSLCDGDRNGESPYGIIVNTDGSRLYVLTKKGIFLVKDETIIKQSLIETAVALAIRNKNLYVATKESMQLSTAQINIFEERDNPLIQFKKQITLKDNNRTLLSPRFIAVDPSETNAYLASDNFNTRSVISIVDLNRSDIIKSVFIGAINTSCGGSLKSFGLDIPAKNLYVLDDQLSDTCVLDNNGNSTPQKNSNLSGNPFPLFGNFIGPDISLVPIISLTPNSLTFTDQKIETLSAPQRINLAVSNAPLTIQEITVQGNNFTIANSSTCSNNQTINSGGSCFIDVVFAPKAPAENKTGEQIVITTISGLQKKVALSGNATLTNSPPPEKNTDSSNNGGGSGGCGLNPIPSSHLGSLFLGLIPFLGYLKGRFLRKK